MLYNILITGGTGSFGQEFVRLLLEGGHQDSRIIVYSRDEQKQEQMAARFAQDGRLRFFIGDVRDKARLKLALRGVNTVVHAAALKIVPALEYNPMEAVKTNIYGTQNLIEAITECEDAVKLIALSTDKAVSPTNLYGATKLCLEKLVIAANNIDFMHHRFSAVRYGNVALSRGSVIPKFREQIFNGCRVTVTDERMTRFWITIQEAAQFVRNRLEDMQGGEIFIPKMRSFRIIDVADLMDGHYTVTGIRPGEKIHELIVSEDEYASATLSNDFYTIRSGDSGNLTGSVSSANFIMNLQDLTEKLESVGVI